MLEAKARLEALNKVLFFVTFPSNCFMKSGFHLHGCIGPFWLLQKFSPSLSVGCATQFCCVLISSPQQSLLELWMLSVVRSLEKLMLALAELWISSEPTKSAERPFDFSLVWDTAFEHMKDVCTFSTDYLHILFFSVWECFNLKLILWKKIKLTDFS